MTGQVSTGLVPGARISLKLVRGVHKSVFGVALPAAVLTPFGLVTSVAALR